MISVFDMFSVGIGPSSSHTVGPMRAAHAFAHQLSMLSHFDQITHVHIELFGSLGQTGKGHGSGKAVILGLSGYEPESIDVAIIEPLLDSIADQQKLSLAGSQPIHFAQQGAITFHRRKTLAKHANAMTLHDFVNDTCIHSDTYYSIGGGFIVHDDDFQATAQRANEVQTLAHPHPFSSAKELLAQCHEHGISISTLMLKNEMMLRSEADIKKQLAHLWSVMQACIQRGIATEGILPGGLQVTRRAPGLHRRLQHEQTSDPMQAMDWVNLFALAVNEENAAGGRVVTAPTNGAAGIIPAVLAYYDKYIAKVDPETASRYLLTAAAIGILYKKNASISGAEVGCQGEVGVACSMAAGALTAILGGNVNAVENAAEIGMEHNLGLTCDPIGGLVQVPCIERNAMGAIKAINASRLALRGDGHHKVSLDKVIKTMRETGKDMKSKYKETARGGLAVNIVEC
jgi:L-serine dehydratase